MSVLLWWRIIFLCLTKHNEMLFSLQVRRLKHVYTLFVTKFVIVNDRIKDDMRFQILFIISFTHLSQSFISEKRAKKVHRQVHIMMQPNNIAHA